MKITFNFSPFDELLKRLDAENIEWHSTALISKRETILHQLQNEGIEVGIDDLDITEEGLFTYAGENIVIYIKDQTTSFDLNLPKFHFLECGTINQMRNANRYGRYFASSGTTGYFLIDHKKGTETITENCKLQVCSKCLKKLRNINPELHKKYPDVEHFNLEPFFKDCHSLIRNRPSEAHNFDQSSYTSDWNLVSKDYRRKRFFCCEKCGVNLSKYLGLLDTHHINGVKQDNRDENLKALCKLCHSQQPAHSHYKPRREHIEIIHRLRKEQGLPTV